MTVERDMSQAPDLINTISRYLDVLIRSKGMNFYSGDKQLNVDDVAGKVEGEAFVKQGLLPALMWTASETRRKAMETALPLTFRRSESDFLGVQVELAGMPDSRSELPLYAQDVLMEARKYNKVFDGASLDHVIEEFISSLKKGVLPGIGADFEGVLPSHFDDVLGAPEGGGTLAPAAM